MVKGNPFVVNAGIKPDSGVPYDYPIEDTSASAGSICAMRFLKPISKEVNIP